MCLLIFFRRNNNNNNKNYGCWGKLTFWQSAIRKSIYLGKETTLSAWKRYLPEPQGESQRNVSLWGFTIPQKNTSSCSFLVTYAWIIHYQIGSITSKSYCRQRESILAHLQTLIIAVGRIKTGKACLYLAVTPLPHFEFVEHPHSKTSKCSSRQGGKNDYTFFFFFFMKGPPRSTESWRYAKW